MKCILDVEAVSSVSFRFLDTDTIFSYICLLCHNLVDDPLEGVVVREHVCVEDGLGGVGVDLVLLDDVPPLDEVGQHALHVEVQVHLHGQPLVHRLVLHL